MIITNKTRKQLLDFLLHRWETRTTFAALERVYAATDEFAKQNNIVVPAQHLNIGVLPCRQIAVIKNLILNILPEASFINYDYQAQAPLNPTDWVEMFMADHKQCISKVKELMDRLKIV